MRSKFIFTLAVICGLSFSVVHAQQVPKISAGGTGYMEYLPQDYNQNSNDYPLVIFLHGVGEKGTTSTDPATLKASVDKVTRVGLAKNVKYGKQYPFILISPQLKSNYGAWPANYVMEVLNHVKKYLRVNDRRIYITGLSLGGFGTWTTLGAYPEVFAAAVPICSGGGALTKACAIASENVALWAFHGTADGIVSYKVTTNMINAVNACTPKPSPLAKATLFEGLGHSIWDKVYNETTALTWMLSFTNGTTAETDDGGSTTTNNPPVVSAGSDQSLTLPDRETYLQGSASDSDGSIASYAWRKMSGPSASLSGYTTSKLRAYNLLEGVYTFRLTAKDNQGAYRYDDVVVTVSSDGTSSTTNSAPIVDAGSDRSLTLPTDEIYLQGTASDSDGSIVSYKWGKLSGPSASLSGYTTSRLRAYNLLAGTYTFRLTVKDDKGAYKSDDVQVTVSGDGTSSTTNSAPIVDAGSDRSLTLPTDEIYLQGTASDSDGSIVSYKWGKLSGPSASLSGYTTSRLRAYNLLAGTYTFRLTVKDDKGAYKSDDVKVIVSGTGTSSTTNIAPVVNAGSDRSLTLPTNEIYLQGTASDSDGSIVSYQWGKLSGPSASLSGYTTSRLRAYNLLAGTYTFRLTAKDDKGAYRSDDVTVTVSGTSTASTTSNLAPVANAGADKPTSLTSITISGSGSDKDGHIVAYKWQKYYGGPVTLTNANTPKVTVSGMKDGKYFLRLTVTDNQGGTDYDNMQIVVNGSNSAAYNIAPISNAGPDKRITDDISSLRLFGSGIDKDGNIVSYKWTQYGGPDVDLINATSPAVTVSGLDQGKYYLKLTVKDNDGSVDSDNMLIVVNES